MKYIFEKNDYSKLYILAQEQIGMNNEYFAYIEVKYGKFSPYGKQPWLSKRDYFNAISIGEATERIDLMLRNLKKGITVMIDDIEFKQLFEPNINEMMYWEDKKMKVV